MRITVVKKLDRQRSFAENAARIVRVRLTELRAMSAGALRPEEVQTQHDLRLAAKRLRDSLEVSEDVFGPVGPEAKDRAKQLQGLLGDLHDCDVLLPRVERHLDRLRDADSEAMRERIASASVSGADLDPGVILRPEGRPAYRGLEVLAVYTRARRDVLHDRFLELWGEIGQDEVWARLEAEADARLDEARDRRRAAKRGRKAAREPSAGETPDG